MAGQVVGSRAPSRAVLLRGAQRRIPHGHRPHLLWPTGQLEARRQIQYLLSRDHGVLMPSTFAATAHQVIPGSSLLHSSPFTVLNAFVLINTVMFLALAIL